MERNALDVSLRGANAEQDLYDSKVGRSVGRDSGPCFLDAINRLKVTGKRTLRIERIVRGGLVAEFIYHAECLNLYVATFSL